MDIRNFFGKANCAKESRSSSSSSLATVNKSETATFDANAASARNKRAVTKTTTTANPSKKANRTAAATPKPKHSNETPLEDFDDGGGKMPAFNRRVDVVTTDTKRYRKKSFFEDNDDDDGGGKQRALTDEELKAFRDWSPHNPKGQPAVVSTSKKNKAPKGTKSSHNHNNSGKALYCVDIETNVDDSNDNPDPKRDEIVEIYIENLMTGKNTGKLFVKPKGFTALSAKSIEVMVPQNVADHEAEITALNENIRKGQGWPSVLKKIRAFVQNDCCGKDVVFIAWNGHRYDFPLMEYEILRNKMDFSMSSFVHCYLDAMVFVMNHPTLWSNDVPPNWKLTSVHHKLIPMSPYNAHDAENDTRAMIEVLHHCLGSNSDNWRSFKDHFLPTSWLGTDLNELDSDKREIAESSLCREHSLHYSNSPILQSQEQCDKIIKELDQSKLIRGDDPRLPEKARLFGCIHYEQESNGKKVAKQYPCITVGGFKNLPLHVIACVAKNGPMQVVDLDDYQMFETASHLCDNACCFNPEHLWRESFAVNNGRKRCYGYVRFVDEDNDLDELFESKECTHDRRCMTCLTVGKNDFDTEEDFKAVLQQYSQAN